MKPNHRLFFAIPFDPATKDMYERICDRIRNQHPSVITVIGTEEIGPSKEYSNITSFKAQNKELTKQFESQIQKADIVIADLTHNNPNVHIELGIALTQNKNILRVTGRSMSELGFDIRNLEANLYKDEDELTKRIMKYLDTFFKIKQLAISGTHPSLYCEDSSKIKLRWNGEPYALYKQSNCSNLLMRDGAVQVEFEFVNIFDSEDRWFGVFFRTGDVPYMGSHLVFVRQNRMIGTATFPGPIATPEIATKKTSIVGAQQLTIEFENDYLKVQLGGQTQLEIDALSYQKAGRICPAVYRASADVRSVKMICRDTLEMV
jgi:nucleoside 2-deoxyribosyltransferase